MRLLFVVQRYGREVAGGSELACRQFATHLAARGHAVDVLTSRAVSYVDWRDEYPGGPGELDGVTVHRLGITRRRDVRLFGPLDQRVVWGSRPTALVVQEAWMQAQGPDLAGLAAWLSARAEQFDVVIFFTYLYHPTWLGLQVVTGRAPTVLHATAHDEPQLWLPIFDQVLRLPTEYAFMTEEEEELISRRTRRAAPGSIIGIGVDTTGLGDAPRFRQKWDLGHRPYLLYLGRVDPAKGSEELHAQFLAYKERHSDDLMLVVAGEQISALPSHPDVRLTGYVDEQEKRDAICGCLALAQPSYFESFSLVLAESWAQGRPALVQGHCDVLAGQARRSRGGIAYRNFPEFEAAVEMLMASPALADRLGASGRAYVGANYAWEHVIDRYERLLDAAMTGQ